MTLKPCGLGKAAVLRANQPREIEMAYYKFTSISTSQPGFDCQTRNGHWNPTSAANVLRNKGCTEPIRVEHCVSDLSGHGRSGHDGRYVVIPDGNITKVANWSEFGIEQ